MAENFAQLFEESLNNLEMKPGALVTATVVDIQNNFAVVDAGLKSEAVIPLEQFAEKGNMDLKIGDEVEVMLDAIEDSTGETRLSREKAKRAQVWAALEKAFEEKTTVKGRITGKVKGGFTVDVDTIRAFLPGSLIDVRPLRDTAFLEEGEIDLKVIKVDSKRSNIVVSRRAVIEEENSVERDALLENLEEGQEIKGIVKNLTDYGCFIDLGGIDGLLHITDMSWKRIRHPSEMVTIGDEITVKVLKFDRERSRVSLGLKQMAGDPWKDVLARFPEGKKLKGKVTNVADYGCFVEIGDGIEGLVHVSEMDWTNKNANPSKIVQLDQEVEVVVLDVDEERRRISLGLKQCMENPWEVFQQQHKEGDKVKGEIRSITDFGVFVGLEGGIDGLIHLSDLSWAKSGEEAVRDFQKGDAIEAVVLTIDIDRERISLGIKQLADDPFSVYSNAQQEGDAVKGKITEVEEKGAHVELPDGVKGYIRVADIAREHIEDARQHLKEGQEVEAAVVNVDRRNQQVGLSIRGLDEAEEKKSARAYQKQEPKMTTTTIGDLIKEKMEKK